MKTSNTFTKHYIRNFDKKVKQFNHSRQLPDHLGELIGGKKKVRIAEVASALVNTIGDTWPNTDVEVVCSDRYGREFMQIWKDNGVEPLHPIYTQNMHSLTYRTNSFDIVHCRNALDHTLFPKKAIKELQRVSRGYVYLEHAPFQRKTYGGHHYWDVLLDEFGMTVFRGKKEEFILHDFKSHINKDGHIVSIWRK